MLEINKRVKRMSYNILNAVPTPNPAKKPPNKQKKKKKNKTNKQRIKFLPSVQAFKIYPVSAKQKLGLSCL